MHRSHFRLAFGVLVAVTSLIVAVSGPSAGHPNPIVTAILMFSVFRAVGSLWRGAV